MFYQNSGDALYKLKYHSFFYWIKYHIAIFIFSFIFFIYIYYEYLNLYIDFKSLELIPILILIGIFLFYLFLVLQVVLFFYGYFKLYLFENYIVIPKQIRFGNYFVNPSYHFKLFYDDIISVNLKHNKNLEIEIPDKVYDSSFIFTSKRGVLFFPNVSYEEFLIVQRIINEQKEKFEKEKKENEEINLDIDESLDEVDIEDIEEMDKFKF